MMKTADVLIFRGISECYTYGIPEFLESEIVAGVFVEVPLGKFQAKGLVMQVHSGHTPTREVKLLLGLSPKKPTIPQDLLTLIQWFSIYYQVTPYQAFQAVVGDRRLRKIDPENPEILPTEKDHPLTEEQHKALAAILGPGSAYLLFGITSSGKTEVYVQAAKQILAWGKQVIILLPEIALTPQICATFKARFGGRISVTHSGLTAKQREIEWTRMAAGQIDIVIGPRSAIFAPLHRIGLIIIDEEHETSYKQDSTPRYYTHTIAQVRAKSHGAKLVLGSATPRIESFYTAHLDPDSQCLRMENRIAKRPLPPVLIVDMRLQRQDGVKTTLSKPLEKAIADTLEKKQKTILLVNRRGYSSWVSCQHCEEVYACPSCQLSFTYHKDRMFRCHRCSIERPLTHICPSCKKPQLGFFGLGTQKLEIDLKRRFPEAKLYRLDKDISTKNQVLEETLAAFKANGDILIGTQLVAKGHHIESVTLVGVLGIDTLLNFPDFRSPERAFQLLTQVSGRAGRGKDPGQVIVQTVQPNHYAILYAASHDFEGFFHEEIAFRQALKYPPFSNLFQIIVSSKQEDEAVTWATSLAKTLSEKQSSVSFLGQILGPKPAPIERVRDYFRQQILIKYPQEQESELRQLLSPLPPRSKTLRVALDFDPRSLL